MAALGIEPASVDLGKMSQQVGRGAMVAGHDTLELLEQSCIAELAEVLAAVFSLVHTCL